MEYRLTFLPTLLLCIFIKDRAVSSISRASKNFLASLSPYLISALHPPHIKSLSVSNRKFILDLSHPHSFKVPRLQACVIAYTTPAELVADQTAASRLAEVRESISFYELTKFQTGSNLKRLHTANLAQTANLVLDRAENSMFSFSHNVFEKPFLLISLQSDIVC